MVFTRTKTENMSKESLLNNCSNYQMCHQNFQISLKSLMTFCRNTRKFIQNRKYQETVYNSHLLQTIIQLERNAVINNVIDEKQLK